MNALASIKGWFSSTRLSRRDRRALVVAAVALVPALLYMAVIKPYHGVLDETREAISLEKRLLERELELLAAKDVLPQRLEQAEAAAQRMSDRLVQAFNAPLAEAQITEHLEELAETSRVLLIEMRAMAIRGESPAGVEPIRLLVRGESDLEGVMTFLRRIEGSPLLLQINEFSLNPDADRNVRAGNQQSGSRSSGVMAFRMIVDAFAPRNESGTQHGFSEEAVS